MEVQRQTPRRVFVKYLPFFFTKILYRDMLTFAPNPTKDQIFTNLKNQLSMNPIYPE